MKIVYVDGFKIRNTLDDDFGLVAWHGQEIADPWSKYFIPEDEIWVDHIAKKEVDFLLDVERKVDEYIAKGGDNYRFFSKSLCQPAPVPDFVKRKDQLNDLIICYIDGSIVRRYIDPYFIFGGHDLVYDYIPAKQIWLDILMDPKEIKYVFLHEKVERDLMEKEGKTYDDAHRFAIAADKEARIRDGFGSYPEDDNFKWRDLSDQEIIKNYYV